MNHIEKKTEERADGPENLGMCAKHSLLDRWKGEDILFTASGPGFCRAEEFTGTSLGFDSSLAQSRHGIKYPPSDQSERAAIGRKSGSPDTSALITPSGLKRKEINTVALRRLCYGRVYYFPLS
ncbi:uncharacterized protein VTP21DRAFT_4574 [Calcarisporiella thermophila]|uniref:uncharacterized protein n=1 Tax=Calcarisporiella thermophila TaxID=911321 RepID=UPI0037428A0B